MTEQHTDWTTAEGLSGFGVHTPADEFLHGTGPDGDALTETWFWSFHVPEASINAYCYCWVHPNLGVTMAGLFIYQGIKRHHLASELFDMPMYLSTATVVGDGSDIRVPNGLRVRVIEPLQELHLTFADPARETEFDVRMRAVAPPVMRANGKHFEQVMHTCGELVLRGERHVVDGHNIRDRSWGELRPEDHVPSPPYNWVTGTFDDGDWAFNVGSLDDPEQDPHWAEHYAIAPEQAFRDGWVRRDGRNVRLVRASKRVEREPVSLQPTAIVIDMEDAEGESFRVTGTIIASVPWGGWHNMTCHLGLVRWERDGHVGHGESMDVQWNDYVWRYGQLAGGGTPSGSTAS